MQDQRPYDRHMRLLTVTLSVAMLAGACTALPGSSPAPGSPGGSPAQSPGETGGPGVTVPPDLTMPPDLSIPPELGQIPEALYAQAAAEAAAAAGVGVDQVQLVRAERVTWSDGSLGCPEEGMGYTQALVPGYRVVIEAAGEELHFHAGQGGDFRYCADPQPPAESSDL